MSDDKNHEQTDAEIIEQEKARTEALEFGQEEVLEDAPRQDGDAAEPSGPMP
jgi:hypothetical protein